jgi:hypothetical protein
MKNTPKGSKFEIRSTKFETIPNDQNSKIQNKGVRSLDHWNIRILNLIALLSRFHLTSGAMYQDATRKREVVSLGRNYLTG